MPVFLPEREEEKPGMAANVRENLAALGCTVELLTLPGSVKTRFIDAKSGQHIMRLDQDARSKPIELDQPIPPIYSAIVISDYNKGCVSYELIEKIAKQAMCPIFVDTKKQDLAKFELPNVFVKINETEFHARYSDCSNLIVTLGSRGTLYEGKVLPSIKVPVSDACGAGDTFLAALVYEYLNTQDMVAAIEFANAAAAVTVKHLGVYAPTLKEINEIAGNS